MKILLIKNYSEAIKKASEFKSGTVCIECEYGKEAIQDKDPGVLFALNHHGKFKKNPAPCMIFENSFLFPKKAQINNFMVSHIDLDVMMSILWLTEKIHLNSETVAISNLIQDTDLNGFHITEKILGTLDKKIKYKFLGLGYILNSFSFLAPETTNDITDQVKLVLNQLASLLNSKEVHVDLIDKIDRWLLQKITTSKKFLKRELISSELKVGLYIAPFGLTTAYKRENYYLDIILQYNEQSRSISLSTFNEEIAIKIFGPTGVQKPLKEFFGEQAGGRISIGGTPRDCNYHPEMGKAFMNLLNREYFNIPEVQDSKAQKILEIKDTSSVKS